MTGNDEIMRAIGRLEGKMDGVQETLRSQTEAVEAMDSRLRSQEVKSAGYGGTAGAIVTALVLGIKSLITGS